MSGHDNTFYLTAIIIQITLYHRNVNHSLTQYNHKINCEGYLFVVLSIFWDEVFTKQGNKKRKARMLSFLVARGGLEPSTPRV